jgi:hypothetical protein
MATIPSPHVQTMNTEPQLAATNNCHDRQPATPTTASHAPTTPPQPPPSTSTITMTTTKASAEMSYPAEGGADDAARLPPRKPPPRFGAARNTSKVVHHDGPGHAASPPWRPRMPQRKEPSPHRRSHHHRIVQPARGSKSPLRTTAIPPPWALLDLPFNGPDMTVPAMVPSSKPTRTLPVIGSPPSFYGGEESRGRGKWLTTALITPTHTDREALR